MVLFKHVEKKIKQVIQPYEDLLAVVVCDTEGACILKVIPNLNTLSNANFHCQKLITCAENLQKLDIGKCRRLLCSVERHKVMVFNHENIVLALFASHTLKTSVLKILEQRLTPVCELLNRYVKDIS